MRRIVLFSLALAVLLGIYFGPFGGDTPEQPSLVPATDAPIRAADAAPRVPEVLESTSVVEPPATPRTEVAHVAASAPSAEAATCVVLGRVVDEEGAPLAQVAVRLSAYKVWAEGVEVPRLAGPYDMRGFELATDEAGAFRIEAPAPTATHTVLDITPDRFHDAHTVRFQPDRSRVEPPLTAGVRDLGEIRLATTGAVQGRVTSADGEPLADVVMGVGPGRSTTFGGKGTTTKADGTYVLGHAPVGTYAVKARAEGFLSGYLEPVVVEARRDTTGIDFVLAAAPTIEGRIVDENGRGVEGARLHGWPSTSGRGAGGKSAADGRFVVHLPQDEPYTLSAQRDGYRTWGDEHDKSAVFAPGTRGVEVVMESLPLTRFAVVDARTGERIDRFGLDILEDNGSKSAAHVFTERRRPTEREHPGGIAEATARVGIDLYVVAAEGYLLAAGDVEHDGPGEQLQTVKLRRGATVRGRVLRDGEAVPGARVEVELGSMSGEGAFRPRSNTLRACTTGADGRFELTALAAGLHRLRVLPGEGAPLVLMPLKIMGSREKDLGDLILLPGASIAGDVLLPPGIEPAGLSVHLDDWRDGVAAVVDGRGRFHLEALAPGVHTLTLDGRPGVLAGSDGVQVELAPGETLPVTLDARDRSMCAVTLTIDLSGVPVSGRQIDLVTGGDSNERVTLGKCDAQGVVTGAARAWGEARVVVSLPGRRSLEHPEVRLELEPRGSIERTVRFEFARLRLALPSGLALPERGTARVELASALAGRPVQEIVLSFADGAASGATPELARAGPGELAFGGILPGSFELTVELGHADTEPQRVEVAGGGYTYRKPAYYSASRSVVLAAGEELALQLE